MNPIHRTDRNEPTQVPLAIPVGELYDLREQLGANRLVWTDRMLTALKSGVKGGKWFSLKDKVYRMSTLEAAWQQVKSRGGCAGVDNVRLKKYESQSAVRLRSLQRKLESRTYQPQAIKRVWIPKPGSAQKRPLGIPTVEDRIVQTALLMVIGPIFEIDFMEQSYGFRPKRGCHHALERVDELLREGYEWIIDADLQGYFDTIDHEILMNRIGEKIADGYVLDLLNGYLKQEIFEPLKDHKPTSKGTPQGAVISPLLSNLYLNELDHLFGDGDLQLVRYADDFVILSKHEDPTRTALGQVGQWCEENRLTLHPEKTKLVPIEEGFEFLGYRFVRHKGQDVHRRYVRKKSIQALKSKLRPKLKRCNGNSMDHLIVMLNPSLRGWFNYFQYSHISDHRAVDGWIRMRLRSILRKRQKKRGRGRGVDHHVWPNKYFAKLGLFSLEQASRACEFR